MNKTVKLYDNTVTINFSDTARNRYIIEETGKSPVGTTTVLATLAKPALMTWPMFEAIAHLKVNVGDFEGASKAYLKKSDSGKDTGTAIHSLIEAFLLGEPQKPTPDAEPAYRAFVEWHKDKKIRTLATEQIVYSKQHDYCGTFDALLDIGGKVVLVDIKTNNASRTAPLGIYPEHFLQLGAYSLAYTEESQQPIDDIQVIRVGKDGVVNTLTASELGLTIEQCEVGFTQVLGAYRFITPLAKTLKDKK